LSGKVCVIGHPQTQVIHVKKVFAALRSPAAEHLMTADERAFIERHVPFTTSLKGADYDYNDVLINKGKWVVKPSDEYASRHVTIGMDTPQAKWRAAVEEGVREGYLLQEHVEPPKSKNLYYTKDGELVVSEFGNIVGLYIFNGKFGGIFTRAGRNAVISAQTGGFSMGTMVVK
jgi:hypothetical protein